MMQSSSESIFKHFTDQLQLDGIVQERRNSIANAMELRLSCTEQSN